MHTPVTCPPAAMALLGGVALAASSAWTAMVVAIAALGLSATAGNAGSGGLDGRSIKQLFPGYFEAQVLGYRMQFAGTSGGGLSGQAYGQQDFGRWHVEGDNLCVEWKQWTKGQSKCGSISQRGGWYVASTGGGELLRFRRTMLAQR